MQNKSKIKRRKHIKGEKILKQSTATPPIRTLKLNAHTNFNTRSLIFFMY